MFPDRHQLLLISSDDNVRMKTISNFSFLFLAILLLGCNQKDEAKIIESMNTDKLKWCNSFFPLEIKVSDDLGPRSEAVVHQAIAEWESVAGWDIFQDPGKTSPKNFTRLTDYFHKDRSTNGVYLSRVPLAELGKDFLAVTQIYFEEGRHPDGRYDQIHHIDIIMNGYYYKFSTDPHDESSYYLMPLLLHEIGYGLGLGHHHEGIMVPGMSTHNKFSTLGQVEAQALAQKYQTTSDLTPRRKALRRENDPPKKLKRVLYYLHKDEYESLRKKTP
jgi:hypothetical protein